MAERCGSELCDCNMIVVYHCAVAPHCNCSLYLCNHPAFPSRFVEDVRSVFYKPYEAYTLSSEKCEIVAAL